MVNVATLFLTALFLFFVSSVGLVPDSVFVRIVAAATINFAPSSVRAATNRGWLLFEGSYYLFCARND